MVKTTSKQSEKLAVPKQSTKIAKNTVSASKNSNSKTIKSLPATSFIISEVIDKSKLAKP